MTFRGFKFGLLLLSLLLTSTWSHADIIESRPSKDELAPYQENAPQRVIKAEDPIVVVPLSNLGATPHTQNLLQLEISDGKFHLRGSLISIPKGGLKFKGPKSEVEKLKKELNRLQRGSDGNGNGGNGGRRNGSDILQT